MTPVEASAVLAETFTSFQGEGPLTGQRCAFVRFSLCNLKCSWCDSKYTWDWSQYDRAEVSATLPLAEVVTWVQDSGVDLLVVTGGEPMLQPRAVAMLAEGLPEVRIQLETNGTIAPSPALAEMVDLWVVSPKLVNSGMTYRRRVVPAALTALMSTGRAAFKFVVVDPDHDFDEIAQLVDDFGLAPVWVMPEGDTPEKVLAGMHRIAGPATARGWNLSTRLHTLVGAR